MKNRKIVSIYIAAFVLMACSKDSVPMPNPTPQNQAPVASAGEDRQEEIGSTVALDASASTDPDGDTLTYKWTFTEKPEESDAVIMGALDAQAEFVLDRAGTYIVNLEVNDGELSTSATVTVTNMAPEITNVLALLGEPGIDDNVSRRGEMISVFGNYLSPVIGENLVTLAGIPVKAHLGTVDSDIGVVEYIFFTVPEEAVGGDLVVTVGPHSTTWPEPIKLLDLPISRTIEANPQWTEQTRSQYDPTGAPFEIGTRFKPLVDGDVIGFVVQLPENEATRLTLWEVDTQTPLVTQSVTYSGNTEQQVVYLDNSIALEKDKMYIVSLNNEGNWYLYIDESDFSGNRYPQTYENIQLLEVVYNEGFEQDFPNGGGFNYIMGSIDIIFVEDIESE